LRFGLEVGRCPPFGYVGVERSLDVTDVARIFDQHRRLFDRGFLAPRP
jgi:hypothetical protein